MSLNGFLNINKPEGRTSRQVVTTIKMVLRNSGISKNQLPKMGHAGTLDPLATGVLVVCLGYGTRFIELLQSRTKSYRVTFLLGRSSNTDDISGDVVEVAIERAARLSRYELDTILPAFLGQIKQVPPDFSAVWVGGKRAYELARRGNNFVLNAKPVEIHRLGVVRFEPPILVLDVECSSGTYIRSLGRDLGYRLGCGAVMSTLTRTRIGPFELSSSIPLSDITVEAIRHNLQSCSTVVSHLSTYHCNEHETALLSHGSGIAPRTDGWRSTNPHQIKPTPSDAFVMLNQQEQLIAVGGWDHVLPELRPRINLIADNEPRRLNSHDNPEDIPAS